MRPQDVLTYLQAKPFRPFRIRMNSGQTIDVRHPEMVRVGRSSLVVFSFVSEDPAIFDRFEMISLLLIERLEHVDAPAAA